MLKDQLAKGGQVDDNEMLQMAEAKVKALEDQVDEQTKQLDEFQTELEANKNSKEELELGLKAEIGERDEEIKDLQEQLQNLKTENEKNATTNEMTQEILNEIRKLKESPNGVDPHLLSEAEQQRDHALSNPAGVGDQSMDQTDGE